MGLMALICVGSSFVWACFFSLGWGRNSNCITHYFANFQHFSLAFSARYFSESQLLFIFCLHIPLYFQLHPTTSNNNIFHHQSYKYTISIATKLYTFIPAVKSAHNAFSSMQINILPRTYKHTTHTHFFHPIARESGISKKSQSFISLWSSPASKSSPAT